GVEAVDTDRAAEPAPADEADDGAPALGADTGDEPPELDDGVDVTAPDPDDDGGAPTPDAPRDDVEAVPAGTEPTDAGWSVTVRIAYWPNNQPIKIATADTATRVAPKDRRSASPASMPPPSADLRRPVACSAISRTPFADPRRVYGIHSLSAGHYPAKNARTSPTKYNEPHTQTRPSGPASARALATAPSAEGSTATVSTK